MSLKERLRWWRRAVQSRGADLKKAQGRIAHFDKVGKQAHNAWVKAKKAKKMGEAQRQKVRAQRAAKKSAWWIEQADDLKDGFKKSVARRNALKKKIKLQKQQKENGSGFQRPSRPWNPYGRAVCGWFVPILDEARQKGWSGVVVSGVRTVQESIGLCEAMCGAPSCAGRCAGATSNHNATTCDPHQGAIDVTDYWNFAAIMRQMGNPIHNDLPIDRVHFSYTGH